MQETLPKQAGRYSLDAEVAVLGSILLNEESLDPVEDVLVPSFFGWQPHQIIFETMLQMRKQGQMIDVVTVHEALQRQGKDNECGGIEYLNQIAQYVASPSSIERYASIIRDSAILREIAHVGFRLAAVSDKPGLRDAAQVLDEAQATLLALADRAHGLRAQPPDIYGLVVQVLDHVNHLSGQGLSVTGVPTGYDELDRMTAGLQPGDLVILAARPSMGKTSLALNIAEHVAVVQHQPVGVFSLEMGAQQLVARMLSSMARIDQSRMRTGQLLHDDWTRLAEAAERMREVKMEIDESPNMTVAKIRASARRMAKRTGGLKLLVVDYLQLMSGGDERRRGDDNRTAELGEISRGLKLLAKELGCTVLALSQLNRAVEARADKRPLMSDLRESGALEQDADIVMFIYRDEYYNKEQCKEPGVAEVIVAKHRNGPTGTVKLAFRGAYTRFDNLTQ